MRKNGKMQRVVMGILATMLVASLVLAVVSFARPAPTYADVQPQDFCYRQKMCSACEGGWRYCMWCWVCCPIYPPCKWSCGDVFDERC